MPSTSKKQHNFMNAIAHNKAFAKKVGVPQSVGKDFAEADKGKKFAKGGVPRPEVEGVNKAKTEHGALQLFSKGGSMKKMAKGGKVSSASSRADGCATKGKTKGKIC